MLDKIAGILIASVIPMTVFAAAFLGSAFDHNSVLAFIIGSAFIVLSALNFALAIVCTYVDNRIEE